MLPGFEKVESAFRYDYHSCHVVTINICVNYYQTVIVMILAHCLDKHESLYYHVDLTNNIMFGIYNLIFNINLY